MSIDIANEAGIEVDEVGLEAVARFTLEQLRIHPLAELSILLVDEQAMTDLRARGIKIAGGPQQRGDGVTQFYVYDPDGNFLEFFAWDR